MTVTSQVCCNGIRPDRPATPEEVGNPLTGRRSTPVPRPPARDDRDPLLTPGEVASKFRVDPKTVTRWAATGRIGSIRTPGGHHRFRESEVLGLLRQSGDHTTEHDEQRATGLGPGSAGLWCNRCLVLVNPGQLAEHNASDDHTARESRPLGIRKAA